MKRFKRALLVGLVAAAMALVLAGCSSQGASGKPQLPQAQVTTPTIGQDGTLRVGVNTQNPPFASQSSNKVVGMDVDLAAALADQLGLKLELVDVGSNPTSAIDDGSVDIVMGVDSNDDDMDAYWTSDDYIPTGTALFATTSNSVPTSSDNPKIEAQSNSMSDWVASRQYGADSVSTTSDLKTAFSDLQSGKADYVACDAVIGTYMDYTQDYGTHIVALMQQPSGYCIACDKSNSALSNAVASALSTVKGNGVLSIIEQKWIGSSLDLSSVALTEGAQGADDTASAPSTSTYGYGVGGGTTGAQPGAGDETDGTGSQSASGAGTGTGAGSTGSGSASGQGASQGTSSGTTGSSSNAAGSAAGSAGSTATGQGGAGSNAANLRQ